MSDEEIRKLLNSKMPPPMPAAPKAMKRPAPRRAKPQPSYGDFTASQMFCPTCKAATPVKERVMLYLPDGTLYEFKCTRCGTQTGTRRA